MRLIRPSVKFLNMTENPLKAIEIAGRTCYKSEDLISDGSAERFAGMLLRRGHEAMVEHASASYRFICDRGVSHEIVRHRLFSYAQESTRYCNYKGGVTFIIPPWLDLEEGEHFEERLSYIPPSCWMNSIAEAERTYLELLEYQWTPQQARSVLPNSLKTEIVVTGNLREWRHFFKLRCAKAAHPQMREVALMALADIKKRVPVIFDEIDA